MSDDVNVSIYANGLGLTYRQGAAGAFVAVPTGPGNGATVSVATQFQSGGNTYKWTKGSWTASRGYQAAFSGPNNGTLKFTDMIAASNVVIYNT
jgi:hypothetical protein